jgi:hypothetical protein
MAARDDAVGRYFEVHLERDAPPSAPSPESEAAPESPQPGRVKQAFIALSAGQKLAESIAPLTALRAVGRVQDPQAADFGLRDPRASLVIRVGGQEHAFVVGGPTPGGRDRYVKLSDSGEVFAIRGNILASLEGAEITLPEKQLHDFGDTPPARVKITRAGASRELASLPGKAVGWAKPGAPEPDDDASTWLKNLDRLNLGDYVEGEQGMAGSMLLFRVEYFGRDAPLGRLELFRRGPQVAPGAAEPAKAAEPAATFYVRTERTRWPVEVESRAASELEQQVGKVVE